MELLFPLLILALLVPTFLGVRRQKKEMAKVGELQGSLRLGDRITTTAGLYGTVVGLEETTVELEIAPGVVTTWNRMVVRERVEEPGTLLDGDPNGERIDDEAGPIDFTKHDTPGSSDSPGTDGDDPRRSDS